MTRFFLALKSRSFLFLFLAELFSQTAMNMSNFVLILVAFSLTNSNTAVSGMILSFTLPAVLFGVLAGALVDVWDKKQILFLTNILRALLLFAMTFFHRSIVVLYIFSSLIAIVTQFFIPAEVPMIPTVVSKKLLLSANALFGIAIYFSLFFAYALSGKVLANGTREALLLLAGLFLVASFFVLFIKSPKEKRKKVGTSLIREVQGVFKTIIHLKSVSGSLGLLTLSQMLIFIFGAIGPGYAKQILNIDIKEFPLLFVTPAIIGMGIGAILLTSYQHILPRKKMTILGIFIAAIAFFFLPYGSKVASKELVKDINAFLPGVLDITILHIMIALAFVLGFANALIFIPSTTLLQEQTTDEIRGKVYGVLNAIVSGMSVIPIILVGSLSDVFGVGKVITVIAIALGVIGTIYLLVDR